MSVLSECIKTKNEHGVRRLFREGEGEILYAYHIGAGRVFHREMVSCAASAASKTLSMLHLPKRLAVRMQDYSVSILSLSLRSSLSVSILSIP